MEFSFQVFRNCKAIFESSGLYTEKSCGIYEMENTKGRVSYKIFAGNDDLQLFLRKNKDKICKLMAPLFFISEYKEYPNTEVRKITSE